MQDLKLGNVLLKTHRIDRRGYVAKVSDFGELRFCQQGLACRVASVNLLTNGAEATAKCAGLTVVCGTGGVLSALKICCLQPEPSLACASTPVCI